MPKKASKGEQIRYYFDPFDKSRGYFVAYRTPKGAIIAASAKISPFAKIGRNCVIYPDVKIGAYTKIGEQVVLYPHVNVGDNCRIGTGVQIYTRVSIGNNCRIGTGVQIENFSTIHDSVSIGIGVTIHNYVEIFSNALIHGFTRICSESCIEAGAIVRTSLANGTIVQKNTWLVSLSPVGDSERLITATCDRNTAELRWFVGCQHGISTKELKARVKNKYRHTSSGGRQYRHAIAYVEQHPDYLKIVSYHKAMQKRAAAAEKKRLAAEKKRSDEIKKGTRSTPRARK